MFTPTHVDQNCCYLCSCSYVNGNFATNLNNILISFLIFEQSEYSKVRIDKLKSKWNIYEERKSKQEYKFDRSLALTWILNSTFKNFLENGLMSFQWDFNVNTNKFYVCAICILCIWAYYNTKGYCQTLTHFFSAN